MNDEEKKQVEQVLIGSENNYRLLIEASPDAIVQADLAGNIVVVNKKALDLGGWEDSRELIGRSVFDFIVPEESELAAHNLLHVLAMGAIKDYEYTLLRKDGSRFSTELNVAITQDASGQPSGLLAVIRDITERKRMQAQLAQSNQLAGIGRLAAGIGHEINNPLAYVLYNLESMIKEMPQVIDEIRSKPGLYSLAEQVADFSERAKDSLGGCRKIRDIARGLRIFTHLGGEKVAQVDLHLVLDAIVEVAINETKYRAKIVKDYGRLPEIEASKSQMGQVFLNLLLNAANSIEEGDVENNEIRLRTSFDGDNILIEVQDTGCGIDPRHIEGIFEPLSRAAGHSTGEGLGLSICRIIIESYGGHIDVESEQGKGSCFRIRLPAVEIHKENEEPAPVVVAPPSASHRGRILVVDDERGILSAMRRMLGRDYNLVLASSGDEGKDILASSKPFDLILCDIMMPRVTGMDLHEWLSEHDVEQSSRMVFMTGGVFTGRAQEYLSRVDNPYIEKPFDSCGLPKMIDELIRQLQ